MPFTKHIIEPNNISQCPLPAGEPNELECLSNLTLANVIRQLSSLGLHAGRIFNELTQEAMKVNHRSQVLNQRIESLKQKCSQLDIQTEEVSLADYQTKKQFKSSIKIDQQVVSRKTMPEAMRIMYENAEPPPALDKLNVFRTDGKDAMKFYTDPEFFFNIWCNELMKDNETRKNEKKRRKTKGDKSQTKLPGVKTAKEGNLNGQQQYAMNNQLEQMGGEMGQQFFPGGPNGQSLRDETNGMAFQTHIYQSKVQYQEYDHSLPSPPPAMVLNVNSTEIHAGMSKLPEGMAPNFGNPNGAMNVNYGAKSSKMPNLPMSNPLMMQTERPMMPPPPVPNNKISDLQQLQQQFVLKKLTDISLTQTASASGDNYNADGGGDLPPPPPPPDNDHDYDQTHAAANGGANKNQANFSKGQFNNNEFNYNQSSLVTVTMSNVAYTQKASSYSSNEMLDSALDMPLPPPPIELQEPESSANGHSSSHANSNGSFPPPPMALQNSTQQNLPPPPPLPPLVESDTASSSTSSLSTVNNSQTKPAASTSEANKNPRRFLDDINERRYQLKSTAKDTSGVSANDDRNSKDTENNGIQPFVNNSDVAAIIDFIRKYRPHVRDSSDEEENSDWDD